MNYEVEWLPEADARFAVLWTTAADPAAVIAAGHAAERQLRRDPFAVGESRGGPDRLMFVPPLAVKYRADWRGRVVRIGAVGWSGRPA